MMETTALRYAVVTRDLDQSLKLKEAEPGVSLEVEYYRENIRDVKSIDEFLANDRLFTFAMTAHGMSDLSYAKGLMRQVLEEGVTADNALANRLTDPRYKEFAETFNFAAFESATTSFSKASTETVDRYVRQRLEESEGVINEGVRLALYFERNAPNVENVYDLLADRALTSVVQTALGLPSETSLIDIDQQAEIISSRLDLEDLSDPDALSDFLSSFAALWDVNNTTVAQTSPSVSLLAGTSAGVSTELLLSIQSLRTSGR